MAVFLAAVILAGVVSLVLSVAAYVWGYFEGKHGVKRGGRS